MLGEWASKDKLILFVQLIDASYVYILDSKSRQGVTETALLTLPDDATVTLSLASPAEPTESTPKT